MPTTDNLPPSGKIKYYVAVRKSEDSNQEFFDVDSLKIILSQTKDKIFRDNYKLPNWTKANPVQRIAEVNIVEIS